MLYPKLGVTVIVVLTVTVGCVRGRWPEALAPCGEPVAATDTLAPLVGLLLRGRDAA